MRTIINVVLGLAVAATLCDCAGRAARLQASPESPPAPPTTPSSLVIFTRDKANLAPLPDVTVLVVGTRRGSITNEAGTAVVLDVVPGAREVRSLLFGYELSVDSVTFRAGYQETLRVQLERTPPKNVGDPNFFRPKVRR